MGFLFTIFTSVAIKVKHTRFLINALSPHYTLYGHFLIPLHSRSLLSFYFTVSIIYRHHINRIYIHFQTPFHLPHSYYHIIIALSLNFTHYHTHSTNIQYQYYTIIIIITSLHLLELNQTTWHKVTSIAPPPPTGPNVLTDLYIFPPTTLRERLEEPITVQLTTRPEEAM